MTYVTVGLLAVICVILIYLYVLGGRASRVDWGSGWLNRLDGINRLFCRHFHHLQTPPLVLPEGRLLMVSNHLSGLDPLLLLALATRPLRFLIAREEYQRWWLRWLLDAVGCIPVDRHGRPEKAMSRARQALVAGEIVVVFPQGGIQHPDGPRRPLKRGAALLACISDSPVLPVRISDVRGHGRTLGALVLPGQPRIESGPLYYCRDGDQRQLLSRIDEFLVGSKSQIEPH